MLKIRAIKLEANTTDGLFGAEYEFGDGLNIVRGDNTTGKSTLFQAILYALGFEELLGGKNEKTMQSALKDQIEFPNGSFHNILQSFVYLEIENKEVITIKRSVVSENRKSQLIDVFFGPYISNKNVQMDSRPMYIHDKGGASDDIYGFHSYLSSFLEWDLPEVVMPSGDLQKLYIQQIAPAFIIEQKAGWSDFFARMPYFGMKNTEVRVIEFLLGLDVFKNAERKQQINIRKQIISTKWTSLYNQFTRLAANCGGTLVGLETSPAIINNYKDISIAINKEEKKYSLIEINEIYKNELSDLDATKPSNVGDNINKNEGELAKLNEKLAQYSLNYELLSPELGFDREKLNQYEKQLLSIKEDIRKNKGALKVKELGATLPSAVANNKCPTCSQDVKESLLPNDIKQIPMRIEDNLSYLEAQQKMLNVLIDGQRKNIDEKNNSLIFYKNQVSEIRQQIRDIKRELIQDERMPSVLEIEKKINLRQSIENINKAIDEYVQFIEDLKNLTSEYSKSLAEGKNLPPDLYSANDNKKIEALEKSFLDYLKEFNYQSKTSENIIISRQSYLPVIKKIVETGVEKSYDIIFDSSASDFIRCIWAYTLSLLKLTNTENTNHPRLLILDEPKQQDISIENFRSFLVELSKFTKQQILVFASFENSDLSFKQATDGLVFKLNRIEQKLIKPVKS